MIARQLEAARREEERLTKQREDQLRRDREHEQWEREMMQVLLLIICVSLSQPEFKELYESIFSLFILPYLSLFLLLSR